MVAHQHIRMDPKTRSSASLPESFQEYFPIFVIEENRFQQIPSVHYMVNGALIFHSHASRHSRNLAIIVPIVKPQGLTPLT